MAGRVDGKTALVTGGGSGIGRATAVTFAREGAKVVVADVIVEGGEETVRMIQAAGGEAVFVKTDVSKGTEVEALIKKTVETYGRLDCAFNNAGIEGQMAPTAESTQENWDRVIAINLTGVWLCMKYEIPQMLKLGAGAIVNTASVAGLVGGARASAYVASKHGVNGLTKTAALEYAKQGIRVNAVCPGGIRTPMAKRIFQAQPQFGEAFAALQPVGRMGKPEEIAEAVVWLCSDAASFVTGLPMAVDGGMTAQ
jgi:NAD(P)-dependent dehydrogenase (short-subunit alcohol dehydrogenase family)